MIINSPSANISNQDAERTTSFIVSPNQNTQQVTSSSTILRSEAKQTLVESGSNNELFTTKESSQSVRRPEYQFLQQRQNRSLIANGQQSFLNMQSTQFNVPPVQQYTQFYQQMQMNVIVVSKEEIEAPWRSECEYLQSIILELENRTTTKTEVVKEYVKEYVNVENTEKITIYEAEQRRLREMIIELQSENGRLKDQLEAKIRELEQFKSRGLDTNSKFSSLNAEIALLRQQIEDKNKNIGDLQQKINQFELRIQLLSQEIENLKQQLRSRDEDILALKRQNESLQSSLSDTGRFREYENSSTLLKNEIIRLNDLYRTRGNEYDQLKTQYHDLENSSSRRFNEYEKRIRDLENTIVMLQSEIDRINGQLRAKMEESDMWKTQFEESESQGVTVIQEKVTYLTQEVVVWRDRFIDANRKLAEKSELLTLSDAHLDSLQKSLIKKEVVSTTSTSRSVRSINTTNSSARNGTGNGTGGDNLDKSQLQSQSQSQSGYQTLTSSNKLPEQ